MKLFIIAALIALTRAARLEHLEQQQRLRAYLPPHQGSPFGSSSRISSSRIPFGAIAGAYGTPGPDQPVYNPHNSFPSASNRYLPPNYEASALRTTGLPRFSGASNGLDAQESISRPSSRYGPLNTFGAPSRYQSHPSAVNREYQAPHSSQNIPQQAFDEETGYHY